VKKGLVGYVWYGDGTRGPEKPKVDIFKWKEGDKGSTLVKFSEGTVYKLGATEETGVWHHSRNGGML